MMCAPQHPSIALLTPPSIYLPALSFFLFFFPERSSLKISDFALVRSTSLPVRVYTNEVVSLWYRGKLFCPDFRHSLTSLPLLCFLCVQLLKF